MALFQKNVLARYVAMQDAQQIDAAYEQFAQYFHDAERQQNILSSKEEQFQEGFLRELFVKILGYTLNPDPAFNLITEKKDVNDSKKADGAILLDGEVIGIIELKDHKTPDLSKVEHQAFGYKNQHPKVRYVIISNFQKLRFYIDNAVEHIEWNLFDLSRDEFAQLWLCLRYDNLSRHLAATVKSESLSSEEQITNKLYKDYIAFKRVLFEDILRRNTSDEGEHSTAEWKILLFKKTQKLLDRLLFIFFAEDSGLLPPNAMVGIINDWKKLKELDAYMPLYSRLRQYFTYLDQGKPEKNIFAYNGGLFKPDEVLDSLDIDDNLLAEHTLRLSEYDFVSEVDVNILGHIFENSLSEIEEVTAQLQNGEAPTVSKRKKDGVFYTPQYITRYIVDNTLGKLCREKREEIGLVEEEYYEAQTRQLKTKKHMLEHLAEYRDWLLGLTICDPACGSGAFLNAALQFLMAEHKSLDKMEAALTGSSIEFPNVENSILENNLYGVDINEESVEIARLSLWLRTAKPFRKLTSLNGNIKCGNSLISDPEIAGDKAFDWQKEFPQVFEKGGFDVVIGNPPYVRVQNLSNKDVDFYFENYKTPCGKLDISILFYERGFDLLNEKGLLSYIATSQWMQTDYGKNCRRYMKENSRLKEIIDFGSLPVFEDADTYPAIFILDKRSCKTLMYRRIVNKESLSVEGITSTAIEEYDFSEFTEESWQFSAFNLIKYLDKKRISYQRLKEIAPSCIGDLTGKDEAFVLAKSAAEELGIEHDILYPYAYRGEEVKAFSTIDPCSVVIYPYDKDGVLLSESYFKETYPNAYNYLVQNYSILTTRLDSRKLYATGDHWFIHLRPGQYSYVLPKKILLKGIGTTLQAGLLGERSIFNGANVPAIVLSSAINEKLLLCILNSDIVSYYMTSICPKKLGGYYRFNSSNISSIPIPPCPDQQPFIELADRMLSLNAELQRLRARFVRRLQENLGLETVSAALQEFDTLTYADFVRELKKQKIKLTLSQQDEWEDYFAGRAAACAAIRADIATTDADINARVYTLYGLTEDEIKIVEG